VEIIRRRSEFNVWLAFPLDEGRVQVEYLEPSIFMNTVLPAAAQHQSTFLPLDSLSTSSASRLPFMNLIDEYAKFSFWDSVPFRSLDASWLNPL